MEYLLAPLHRNAGVPSLDELLVEVFKRLDEKLVPEKGLGLSRSILSFSPCLRSFSRVYPSSLGA